MRENAWHGNGIQGLLSNKSTICSNRHVKHMSDHLISRVSAGQEFNSYIFGKQQSSVDHPPESVIREQPPYAATTVDLPFIAKHFLRATKASFILMVPLLIVSLVLTRL